MGIGGILMGEIKLCKDCKHAKKTMAFTYQFAKCTASVKDYSTGEGWYCATERQSFAGACGPNAKKFEQRKPAWYAFWRAA